MGPVLELRRQTTPPPRSPSRPLDVAIAGTRGVPARYGGFETFAEELGARLAARGHAVTVYGRPTYVGAERRTYRGMHVVPVASPRGKHLETPLHTLASALRAWSAHHDVVLLCNGANAFALPLFRWAGARTVINLDGIERLRRKWGWAGRLWYSLGERLALGLADEPLADAEVIRDYYRARHGRDLRVISYGGDRCPAQVDPERVRRFGLKPGGYVLHVGRLEPENNALHLVRAYRRVEGSAPLVVVGDAPYASAYKRALREEADPRVVFTGGVYGEDYFALQQGAACYVAAGEVGGTHPALLEAMSFGGPILANDVPEHREVVGPAGLYFAASDPDGLARQLERLLGDRALGHQLQAAARERARRYRWDEVARRYEELFTRLVEGGAA